MQPRRLSKRCVLGSKLGTGKASSKGGMKKTLPPPGTGFSAGRGEEEEERIDVVQEEAQRPSCCPSSVHRPYQETHVISISVSEEQQDVIRQTSHMTSDNSDHATEWKNTSSLVLRDAIEAEDSEQEIKQEHTSSICLLEQKRKVVSSNMDVPHVRKYEDELDMDKVTAAMVLTTLSTSPLVCSPPIQLTDANDSWKDSGYVPFSSNSSGYCSWNTASDYSDPSTPSPPLSADSFKHFQCMVHPDDSSEDIDSGNLFFEAPIPRKRKNSTKVMFRCLWKKCGKILNTAAGIKKHIRTIHLGRTGELDDCDGEEDFYYTEIRLNNDSGTERLCSLSPASPSFASPPSTILFPSTGSCDPLYSKTEIKLNGNLSRSAPNNFYLVQSNPAYQVCLPCNTNSEEYVPAVHTVRSSPPKAGVTASRKPRGEGKKCRKVYGMENKDKWCTACRWKKACQRFPD